jgi:hypothetical protein
MSGEVPQIVARYASCASYEDRGTSVTTFTPEDGSKPRRLVIEFETTFDRARGGFRFEYRASGLSHEKRCILWRAGPGPVRAWWSQSAGIGSGELESLLSVHAGTSAGTSSLVPVLLLGRPLPYALTLDANGNANANASADANGDADADDDAWKIEARGRRMTLWARKSDLAIVRWVARHRRVKMGDLLGRGKAHDTADAVAALHRSTIEQAVTLTPTFDVELAPTRFDRISE